MHLALSLIVSALSLPSQAQYQPPGGGGTGPHWKTEYIYAGTTTATNSSPMSPPPLNWATDASRGNTIRATWSFNDLSSTAKIVSTGTVKVKFTYVDGAGTALTTGPSQVWVHERASASYSTDAPTDLVTISDDNASNGLGAVCFKSGTPPNAGMSLSHYDEIKDGSSGTFEVTVTQTSSITVTKKAGATVPSEDQAYGQLSALHDFTAVALSHAHPTKMRRDPRWPDSQIKRGLVPDGSQNLLVLGFKYVWESTGGGIAPQDLSFSDLGSCRVQEYITWSGSGHEGPADPSAPGYPLLWYFYPDSPPFTSGSIPSPKVSPGVSDYNGNAGSITDVIATTVPTHGQYSQADVVGNQIYRFHCDQCMLDGEFQRLLGPFTIHYKISSADGVHWFLIVSRDGVSDLTPLN